jgi:hypothetical protein
MLARISCCTILNKRLPSNNFISSSFAHPSALPAAISNDRRGASREERRKAALYPA